MNTSDAVWWQTPVATVAALVLFLPLVFVAGLWVVLMDFLQWGATGKTDDGVGFILRGFQHGAAAGFAVFLPHLLLNRSNSIVVATVLATVATLFLLYSAFVLQNSPTDLYGWLDLIASGVGVVVGAVCGSTVASERTLSDTPTETFVRSS